MADIVLSTFNARFSHPAFGLRYLLANLGDLAPRAELMEFDLKHSVSEAAKALLAQHPRVIGLSAYIWNIIKLTDLVKQLRASSPRLTIVLGGPEISYEIENLAIASNADYIVAGEGDLVFGPLCRDILTGYSPSHPIVQAPTPSLDDVALPYDLYTEFDLNNRITYVETSRGCPFQCDYCVSAIGDSLRYFSLDRILPEFEKLISRGARTFKFVDRTFNLNINRCLTTLDFFLSRWRRGMTLHFEMVPQRFPNELREMLRRFPAGALDLEIGVQTLNAEVAARIHRNQNPSEIENNLRFLRQNTGAVLHVDLIAGLPGETWESIRDGFDRLVHLRPHRLQLGILKRLRGAPISRHDAQWRMVYEPEPPYSIVSNATLSAEEVNRIKIMAKIWDRIANRNAFPRTLDLIRSTQPSVWDFMMDFSENAVRHFGRNYGISLREWAEYLYEFFTQHAGVSRALAAEALSCDYSNQGRRRDLPRSIRA